MTKDNVQIEDSLPIEQEIDDSPQIDDYRGYLAGATKTNHFIGASPVFEKNFKSKKDIVINRGGTRAGKTYNIMIMLANWLLTGIIRENQYIESGVASVVRKTLPELRESALQDFLEILSILQVLETEVSFNKTHLKFTYKHKQGKRVVEFH